jgi:hypothetical protein
MRLLKLDTDGNFKLTRFAPKLIPQYAILSHTWETDNEDVTFQDLMKRLGTGKRGYKKIEFCCNKAKQDGLVYFWIDSCCIDQSSSAELSQAINSMFRWYRKATKCYVYLSDIPIAKYPKESPLSASRWFTRGWTLQELLAPTSVEFFSREGTRLGDKKSLELDIQKITRIPVQALRGEPLSQLGIDKRLSWIANRETTIEEDMVYSVLGLFNVHIPLIYGEGVTNALRRLGEEIKNSSTNDEQRRSRIHNSGR